MMAKGLRLAGSKLINVIRRDDKVTRKKRSNERKKRIYKEKPHEDIISCALEWMKSKLI